jgi:NDP-sugar pyrophosphorylase family protein
MLPALVLTAGFGARLDPLTRLVAKPVVPVAGRALVERVLAWLNREGVRDVLLNLHARPESVAAVVGDGAHLGLRVRYSWEQPLLGSAGGPRHALPLLDSASFLIVNGDTLCDFPLAPMIAAHLASGAEVTLAVIPNPAPDRYNGVVIDEGDRVRAFVPKGQADGTWHFVGVQVANAAVFAGLADGVPAETVSGLYRHRLASGGIRAWRADTSFLDVGTPRDYLHAALSLAGGSVVEPGSTVDPSARVARSVVWPGARIGAHVTLEDCVVAGGVHVPPGFTAREAVLVPASLVRAGDRAETREGIGVFPFPSGVATHGSIERTLGEWASPEDDET